MSGVSLLLEFWKDGGAQLERVLPLTQLTVEAHQLDLQGSPAQVGSLL
jgi:hypothetical protein